MQTVHYLYAQHKAQDKPYLLVNSLDSTYNLTGQQHTLGIKHGIVQDVVVLNKDNQVIHSGAGMDRKALSLPTTEVEWIKDMIVLEA